MNEAAEAPKSGSGSLEAVPPVPKVPCVLCASPIDAAARVCLTCKGYQAGKACVACGKWIPARADDCTECKASQKWWRRFITLDATVLALLISLISVVSSVGPGIIRMINHGSQTSGFVIGPEPDPQISKQKDVLLVRATNSGGQPSIVSSAHLDLMAAGGGIVALEITNRRDKVVAANGSTDLKLFAADDDFKIAPDAKAKVMANLCSQPATLHLQVEEKSAFGGGERNRDVSLPIDVKTIRSWAGQRLTSTEPEACQ